MVMMIRHVFSGLHFPIDSIIAEIQGDYRWIAATHGTPDHGIPLMSLSAKGKKDSVRAIVIDPACCN
jgi:hypothetical protein